MSRKQQGPAFREFDRRVREMTSRGVDRMRACELVARRDPQLHRTMIVEQNMGTTCTTTLEAVLDGSRAIHDPVQRPGVTSVKQATTSKPAPQAAVIPATVPAIPVAVVAPAAAAPQQSEQARLDAALAKRHARGLDGSLAVLDLLNSPDAHLWTDVRPTTARA